MVSLALGIATVLGAPAGAGAQSTPDVAFQSDRDGNDTDLWLVADGTERELTSNDTPDASPSWSPDGTTIVYACAPGSNWDLCTIDPATMEVTRLTRTAADEFDPRYTSDGSEIVLETYSARGGPADIAIVPAAGGTPKRLTFTAGVDDQDPAPDPGSTQVAFAADEGIAVLDTTVPRKLTRVTPAGAGDTDPSFSSHGEIAFATLKGDAHDLVVAGPVSAGRPIRRLTTGAGDDVEPAWTSDATELFFARDRSARGLRIYRIGSKGGGLKSVTRGGSYDDAEPAPRPVSGGALARTLRVPPGLSADRPPGRAAPSPLLAFAATCAHTYIGTSANNTLGHSSGNDCIYGRAGNDKLNGGSGRDRLYGESGDDRIKAVDGEQDYLSDGKGNDQCWRDGLDTGSLPCH